MTKQLFASSSKAKKKYVSILRTHNVNKSHHAQLTGIARNTFNFKSKGSLKQAMHLHKKNVLAKFFKDISISTEYPNKKDIHAGESLFILKASLRETFNLYKQRDDAIDLSFATFAALRPKNVKLVSAARWRQCLCTTCEYT